MGLFIRAVNGLSWLCGILAALMIAVSVAIVCQMVFMRYVLNASTYWQTEFVIYMMISATVIGAPYVQRLRGHVNVDLLPIYLKGRARFGLDVFAKGLSLAVSVTVAYYGAYLAYEAWDFGWRSDTVWGVHLWRPFLAIPVGFGILSLQLVADLLALFSGRDKPFDIDDGEA